VKDKHKEYTTFNDDKNHRIMIAHPMSGGMSINLVAASYCVFFSNGYKVIDRKQCEKRIHRAGQKSERVFYYDLIGKDTIEKGILENLMNGLDSFDRILNEQDLINMVNGSK
jgi:SNF2 family DNA or RNA helicase